MHASWVVVGPNAHLRVFDRYRTKPPRDALRTSAFYFLSHRNPTRSVASLHDRRVDEAPKGFGFGAFHPL